MKILFYTDVHWCKTSTIVVKRGKKFSTRLENLIHSMNWVEDLGKKEKVDEIVCLGDFFDRPNLNDEELTALNEVQWYTKAFHHFLVGNHEIMEGHLTYSSAQALGKVSNSVVEDSVYIYPLSVDTQILFLPYIVEENRKTIQEYIDQCGNRDPNKKLIVCSHNDIKGIHYGKVESVEGFDLEDINDSCSFFINGHLHNGDWLNKNKTALNLGNLTGQNFGEDAFKYKHQALILDTDTMEVTFYENPYAFNFYNILIKDVKDMDQLNKLKEHAIVKVKCNEKCIEELKEKLPTIPNVELYKIGSYKDIEAKDLEVNTDELVGVDNHLEQFQSYILSRDDEEFADKTIVKAELLEVCK